MNEQFTGAIYAIIVPKTHRINSSDPILNLKTYIQSREHGSQKDNEFELRNQVEELQKDVASLQHIKEDYQEIVEHATEIIYKLDSSGSFYFVSAEFGRLLGYSNEQISGKHFTSIVHPDDLQICIETFEVLRQFGKSTGNISFRVRHEDGGYKWVNCSAVCLFDEKNNPSHVIGFAHDITQLQTVVENLQTSEKALRISEERYRSLFDALGEGAALIDANGRIIAWNRYAEKILGVSKEQILMINTFDINWKFFHEDGSEFPLDTHPGNITLKTGESLKGKIMGMQRPDGQLFWISLNTEPIYHSESREKPDAVVASFVDITQARIDKEELARNHKLLALENERYIKATKAVAQAVVDAQEKERADIGYELHDNVNQILSTSRLLLDLALNDEKERLNLISKSAEGIANAVSELRKISRSLVPASLCDLGLIASIEDLIECIQSTKKIKVEFYYTGDLESLISENGKLMLFRIIQEQVTNVLKHSEASRLVIEMMVDSDLISLSITDNGKGFDKEGIKSKKGVGLHNIANRAELFNGKIHMVTSPGNGCKLNILIPL